MALVTPKLIISFSAVRASKVSIVVIMHIYEDSMVSGHITFIMAL